MARANHGPKNTASGWPGVYNQPKVKGGATRWVFWRGKPHPKTIVRGNDLSTESFWAAYTRFAAGLHPYEDNSPRSGPKPAAASPAIGGYPYGTVGWLLLKLMKSEWFLNQKNGRAIEGQYRWIMSEPVNRDRPDGRKIGEVPLGQFTAEGIQKLIARKVDVINIEVIDEKTGRRRTVPKTVGDRQANNIVKWLRPFGKLAVREKFWQHNLVLNVEKYRIRGGGFKMWTDEMWDRVMAKYPPGTKPHLVMSLAGYTGQRRGDVYVLGVHNYLPPESGLPFGSLHVEQEKGDEDDGEPYIAHVPILPELHLALEAARTAGVLGSKFFVRQDHNDAPYASSESFGNRVREWLDEAEVPKGYSLHGLRKLFVCRLIERGCDPHEVMAATGHQTLKEIDRYAKGYFRQKKKVPVYEKWRTNATQLGVSVGSAVGLDDAA